MFNSMFIFSSVTEIYWSVYVKFWQSIVLNIVKDLLSLNSFYNLRQNIKYRLRENIGECRSFLRYEDNTKYDFVLSSIKNNTWISQVSKYVW